MNTDLILGQEHEEVFISDKEVSAVSLDQRIREHTTAIGEHFIALAQSLKQMRDEKLYIELGYNTFDAYIEGSGHPFGSRQAYNYIRVYENFDKKFIEEHSSLGVTKLEMLTKIFRGDVENFIEENNVEEMSSRELKEAIDKINALSEQVSFLTDENDKLKAEKEETELPADVLSEINELRKKCESLSVTVSERDKEVDGLADARLEAENKLNSAEAEKRILEKELKELKSVKAEKKKLEKELKDLKAKPVEVAVAEPSEEQVNAIRKEITDELSEKYEKELAELKSAAEESAELRRKLSAAQNDEVKEFKIYFEDTKSRLEHLFSVLDRIPDEETKQKMKTGLVKFLDALKGDLE